MKKSIYYFAFILLLISCTEKMDVDLGSTYTRLTVEAKLTSDLQKHFVKLSESSDVFYNQSAVPIKLAQIVISDGITDFTFTETKPGFYESVIEFAGEPGRTYSLNISNVDIDKDGNSEEYFASATMPYPYQIDGVKMHYDDNFLDENGDRGEFWLLELFMQDNANQKDYYGFASRINNVLVDDTITEVLVVKDTYFNGESTKGVEAGEFDQSKPDEIIHNNDEITLECYAITEDYYEFVTEFQLMDEEQSPLFSGSPSNIRTNISNEAIGYFAVYSITRSKAIVKTQ